LVKPAIFHPSAIAAIRLFPQSVRKELGKAILDLQNGERPGMPLSRPLPSVAGEFQSLDCVTALESYRASYYTQSPRGILVFHAFADGFQGLYLQTLM
jgi:phage-related protein